MSTERRRGRPCRAGTTAKHRVEMHLTDAEFDALLRFAAANQITRAEALRFALASVIADSADDDEKPVIVIGGVLQSFGIIRRP